MTARPKMSMRAICNPAQHVPKKDTTPLSCAIDRGGLRIDAWSQFCSSATRYVGDLISCGTSCAGKSSVFAHADALTVHAVLDRSKTCLNNTSRQSVPCSTQSSRALVHGQCIHVYIADRSAELSIRRRFLLLSVSSYRYHVPTRRRRLALLLLLLRSRHPHVPPHHHRCQPANSHRGLFRPHNPLERRRNHLYIIHPPRPQIAHRPTASSISHRANRPCRIPCLASTRIHPQTAARRCLFGRAGQAECQIGRIGGMAIRS